MSKYQVLLAFRKILLPPVYRDSLNPNLCIFVSIKRVVTDNEISAICGMANSAVFYGFMWIIYLNKEQ